MHTLILALAIAVFTGFSLTSVRAESPIDQAARTTRDSIDRVRKSILQDKVIQATKGLATQVEVGNIKRMEFERQKASAEVVLQSLSESKEVSKIGGFVAPDLFKSLEKLDDFLNRNCVRIETRIDPATLSSKGTPIPGLVERMRESPSRPMIVPQDDLSYRFVGGISMDEDVAGGKVLGSCFYLTNLYFVTAYHVVKDYQKDLYVFSQEQEPGDIVPRHVFKIDRASAISNPAKDLYLFRTFRSKRGEFASDVVPTAKCVKQRCDAGRLTACKIAGFPRQTSQAVLTDNIFFVDRLPQWDAAKGDLIAIGPTWKGYSGAPLIDSEGCVIGVVRWQSSKEDIIDGTSVVLPPVLENCFGAIDIQNALALLHQKLAKPQ